MPKISLVKNWFAALGRRLFPEYEIELEPGSAAFLEDMKDEMRRAVEFCSCEHREHALIKISRACSRMDLWLLRPDVFQYLVHDFGHAEAARRLTALRPVFAR